MVCGTCQATFAVKLKLTQVSAVPSNLQEVRWLAKHCPFVEVVRLHMADGSGAAEVQAIEACNPAASFDRVRQLGVSGNHSNLPERVFLDPLPLKQSAGAETGLHQPAFTSRCAS